MPPALSTSTSKTSTPFPRTRRRDRECARRSHGCRLRQQNRSRRHRIRQADTLVGFAEEQRDLIRILFHPDGEAGDVPDRILERLAAGVSARRKERAAIGQSSACFDTEVLAQAVVGMWARVLVWWAEDPSRATRDDLVRTLTHFTCTEAAGSSWISAVNPPAETTNKLFPKIRLFDL